MVINQHEKNNNLTAAITLRPMLSTVTPIRLPMIIKLLGNLLKKPYNI